jgi:hypothetical protein
VNLSKFTPIFWSLKSPLIAPALFGSAKFGSEQNNMPPKANYQKYDTKDLFDINMLPES